MFVSKRSKIAVVLLAVVLAALSIGVAAAQDSIDNIPGGGWWTGTQIQNVGADTATLTIASYHKDDSSKDASKTDTINKDASKTFLPSDLNLGAGEFQGSATVSSNQPLRAIVNTTNMPAAGYGIPGGTAAGQYQGVNTPATELNFPLAKNDHSKNTTTFYIQNAGGAAATATAEFKFPGGNCTITTPTIQPNRMAVVSPATNASCGKGTSAGLGSLKVTSSQALAGVVLEHRTVENPASFLMATRGFAPADADTKVFAPIIKSHWNNRFTGLQIQNASGGNVNVKVTYKGAAGACAGQTYTSEKNGLTPGESVTFVHIVGGSYGNPMPVNCLAAATVEATGGNIVAIVNESHLPDFLAGGGNGGRNEATTYSAFPAKYGTTKISIPLYKEDFNNRGAGIQVQNISGSPATNVVLKFVQTTGAVYTTKPQTIGAGESKTFLDVRKDAGLWAGTAMPGNTTGVFGVVVTADQNVVAVANEAPYPWRSLIRPGDNNNFEGFNLTP